MSYSIYTNYNVHTYNLPVGIIQPDPQDMLPDCTTCAIVMGESYQNNVTPHIPKWHIDFIGSMHEFTHHYLNEMGNYYDDGLVRSQFAKSSNGFSLFMLKLLQTADKLSTEIMRKYGYSAYSWSDSDTQRANLFAHKSQFQQYGDTRYGRKLTTESDIEEMLSESFRIKSAHQSDPATNPQHIVWHGRPWICTPSMLRTSANA